MKVQELNPYKHEIIDKYLVDKLSIKKISEQYSCSQSTIRKFLLMSGVTEEQIKTHAKYDLKPNLFNKISTEEDAYWLGLLYADGHIATKGYEISLDLKAEDKYLVEQFRQYCGCGKELRKHIIKRNDKEYISYVCNFSSKEAKNNLIELGCVPAKSLILTCPTEEQVPQKLFSHFVRGYCDGDGYLRWEQIRHKEIIIAGTEKFLTGIAERMNWNNVYIKQDPRGQVFTLTIWRINEVYQAMKQIYEDAHVYMVRKHAIFLKAQKYMNSLSLAENKPLELTGKS